ncbi:MAG: Gfo/Idh/MocA family oxidoreductase [Candidatus Latescibacterota bacterium]|jgi:UDP-2-acetamido-3-amino-2,3-dideoxy-glucuronate N-acetyltransferase
MPDIAVVGAGYWGRNLVRVFHQLGALRTVCDHSEAVLGQMQTQYPGVRTVVSLPDALGSAEITGVVIASPAETHYLTAREALLAGKHVFVEKPMTLREDEALELIRLAEAANRTLMVGHLLQYHPIFVRLKEMTLAGDLGRVNYIYSHRLNLGKIRREENILWSFAPHDISMILALAGEMPDGVLALGGNYLHRQIADVTTTHLTFPSGMLAHVFVSWLHPFKEQKLVVVGDQKMAVFDDTLPWAEKLLLYPHQINWQNNVPVPSKAESEAVDVPQSEPLLEECRHFLACVGEGRQPLTDGAEGLRVLTVLNAAQGSLDTHGQRVSIGRPPANDVEPKPAYFAHSTAVLDEGVQIGEGTKVWHFSHIMGGTRVGRGCNIGQNVVIGPDVTVGNGCKIQNNVSVYKGVTLEDDVFCGPSMVFTNVFNPRAHIRRMDEVRPTLVSQGASLGANCTVVCGTTIGRHAFVGAGAVVTRDVPDYGLVYGNPARLHGWVCACGVRLGFEVNQPGPESLSCPGCGAPYSRDAQGVKPA